MVDQRLNEILKIIEEIELKLSQFSSGTIPEHNKEFFLETLRYCKIRLRMSISSLLYYDSNNIIGNLSRYINNIKIRLNNNQGQIGSILQELRNDFNSIINLIGRIPIYYPNEEDINKVIENFSKKMKEELKKFQSELEKVRQNNAEINKEISNIQNDIGNFKDNIYYKIKTFEDDFNKLKQIYNEQFEKERMNITNRTNEIMNNLSNMQEEAKKIVSIIGNAGVTGGYQQNAEYHRKQANMWRWISIGFMIISVVYLGITIFTIGKIDWFLSLLRILAVSILIYPAQYAAYQSNKHREQEFYNKKMELDLSAINPFIELFDEKKKQEIKEKLVEKYFNTNLNTNKSESHVPITIFEKITNLITNIINSVK